MMADRTTIPIDTDTRDRLRGAKRGGETYAQAINRVLDAVEPGTGPDVEPGRWPCDGCGGDVSPDKAHTKEVPGYDGPETLAFCEDCWNE